MSKKPIVIFAQTIDKFFVWQCQMYIESCLSVGFEEEQLHCLLYKPNGREYNSQDWDKLKECYPKLNLHVYEDRGAQQYISIYIPIIRPHLLWQHFEKFPYLENETIIYTDCDILWRSIDSLTTLFEDDVCYISDAKSYMNVDYFNSKIKDVLPEKLEEYKTIDIVQDLCTIVGISKDKAIENNNNTGGVQYILKNVNADFWKKVEKDVLSIRVYLQEINRKFFANENKGIQSWCADLWAIQYNLWMKDTETKVVPEMNFSWATSSIETVMSLNIFHNAGVSSDVMNNVPYFYKGKYHRGNIDPTKDPHLNVILNNEESKKYGTWYYASKLKELSNKYNLNY